MLQLFFQKKIQFEIKKEKEKEAWDRKVTKLEICGSVS